MARRQSKSINGQGSVSKRKDTGRWVAKVTIGWKPDGSQQRISRSFDTREQADRWRMQTVLARDAGTLVLPDDTTFSELIDSWSKANPGWVDSTRADNAGTLQNLIAPHIGDMRVSDIRPGHVQALYNKLRAEDRIGVRGQNLGPVPESLLYRAAKRLRACLNYAVRLELIERNPADAITVSRPEPKRQTRWSIDEVKRVLTVCGQYRAHATIATYVRVALMTGLRKEELRGLRWADVNLLEQHLTVNQVVVSASGSRLVTQPRAKTEAGHRRVTFDAVTRDALLAHKDEQELVAAGTPAWQHQDLVFPSSRGTPLGDKTLRRHFNRIAELAEVPRIRPYDTRSTHGSLLAEMGFSPKAIADRMGHAQVSFTMQTYVRPSHEEHESMALAMGELGVESPGLPGTTQSDVASSGGVKPSGGDAN